MNFTNTVLDTVLEQGLSGDGGLSGGGGGGGGGGLSNGGGSGSIRPTVQTCIYCNREFRHHDLFAQHFITCQWFFKTRRERGREIESFETLPSAQETYHLIQHLALQVSSLQTEVAQLRQITMTKKRKMILDWLLNPSNRSMTPSLSLVDWIKETPVSNDHLMIVFQVDLIEGIKAAISAHFDAYRGRIVPICAFHQKPGTLFVYHKPYSSDPADADSVVKWRIMTADDFERWMDRLGTRFLQVFLKWQMDNAHIIRSSMDEKEKNLENMRKINGLSRAHEERRRSELRKWLFIKLAVDFVQYE